MNAHLDIVKLFTEVLGLCGVRQGESLAALTEDGIRDDYADAFVRAAYERGASSFHSDIIKGAKATSGAKTTALSSNRAALKALKGTSLLT